jgi:hypothetical protein
LNRSPLRRALTLALAVLAAPTATAAAAPAPATTSLRQRATVDWDKGRSAGNDRVAFAIPGIGSGEIVCRPDALFIRVTPNDRTQETSLWSAMAQVKGEEVSYVVKNARIFQFGTPTTPQQATGTGPSAQEGLNVEQRVEPAGSGVAVGLISQRTALNAPAAPTAPLTSVRLAWSWSGFGDPTLKKARCKVVARLVTKMPAGTTIKRRSGGGLIRRPGPATNELFVDWHGEQDAPGKTESGPVQIPYLGTLRATCPTGRDSNAQLILNADDKVAGLKILVTRFQGEGPEAYEYFHAFTDPSTGEARIALPTNGFVVLEITGKGGRRAHVPVSTWRQTNDEKTRENFCEIAAQTVSKKKLVRAPQDSDDTDSDDDTII